MAVTTSAEPTAELARREPGFDATPIIADAERGLRDFLNTPAQHILNQLPLQRFPDAAPPEPPPPSPIDPTQVVSPILGALGALGSGISGLTGLDPIGLIAPVVNALGALGTGQFSGIDPTQILGGVSAAFDRTAPSLQQAQGSLANDWRGGSGTAAGGKTQAAVANGAEVATQADRLRDNLSTAATSVAQARMRMIDVIDDFNAKIAAVDVTTPAGRATAIAAANQAHKDSTAIMTDLQRRLGTQAQEVSKIGEPVPVTKPAENCGKPKTEEKKPAAKPQPDPALNIKLPDGTITRAPNVVAAKAVRNALTQIGVPYQWGAKSPGKAFDCSGLTQWAYEKAGKQIPRVSNDQDVGAKIPRADVKPGDLVVWSGHVAMVVGDGKMIEAGDPVGISPIRTNNLDMKFYGFYRPTA